jgi:protease I
MTANSAETPTTTLDSGRNDMSLNGTRVLMVIAPEDFRDEELLEPKKLLTEAGAQVTVASTREGEASGMLGATIKPDAVVDSLKAADYHAVVVVGGMGSPTHLWNHSHVHKLLKETHTAGRVVGAICLSGAVLANAGVLAGKRATVWATDAALQQGNARYVKEHVVHDGNVVTADGPEAAPEFGRTLITALKNLAAKV